MLSIVNNHFFFPQVRYLLFEFIVVCNEVGELQVRLAQQELVLAEQVAHAPQHLPEEVGLRLGVWGGHGVLERTLGLLALDVAPDEVVLAHQLQVELLQRRQVHLLHIPRQVLPLRVRNQIEDVCLAAVEDQLFNFAVLLVD